MNTDQPSIVVLAGPNGAGKTTAAPHLLHDTLGVDEFVNADWIAKGLAGFAPDTAAMEAGRILLQRLKSLAATGRSFAFETTLASRSFAPWLLIQKSRGYEVHLVYLWLPSARVSVRRVAERVIKGGHDVPVDVIERRFRRGLRNLFDLYIPLATTWRIYENSGASPRLVANGSDGAHVEVVDSKSWAMVLAMRDDPRSEA